MFFNLLFIFKTVLLGALFGDEFEYIADSIEMSCLFNFFFFHLIVSFFLIYTRDFVTGIFKRNSFLFLFFNFPI